MKAYLRIKSTSASSKFMKEVKIIVILKEMHKLKCKHTPIDH